MDWGHYDLHAEILLTKAVDHKIPEAFYNRYSKEMKDKARLTTKNLGR